MIIIACVDDNLGMMFNHRRQSRDRVVVEKILEITENHNLWVNQYSYSLFDSTSGHQINIDDSFLTNANEKDYCFIENCNLKPYKTAIEKIILFKWNRTYPSDFRLDIDLSDWKLTETTDFIGNSHNKITMEVHEQ